MTFKGQPVPTTVVPIPEAKISDGKSVRVAVPESTTVEAGKFHLLGGFLGAAMQSVTTGAGETAEVILNIEPAEYETEQTKEADRPAMTAGKDIYWDKTEKHFTVTGTAVYAGKVTAKADANGVIWFKLAERPFATDDVTALAAQVGSLDALTTTAKASTVAAINEVDAKVVAKVAPIADPSTATAEEAATQLNALITALTTAGLMAAGE